MTYSTFLIEQKGPVTRITLNRPDVRNAFDQNVIRDLQGAFSAIAKTESIRAVVLQGAGKAFCAGADVNWMRSSLEMSREENEEDARRMAEMFRTIDECPKPVIGKIHGAALGGGSGLAGACDIVVASEETKFSFSEVRLGILPAVISSFVLPKIGVGQARRYFLTGETFPAKTARSIGLVHEVVPAEQLDAKVQEIVDTLLKNGPRAVSEAKALIHAVRSLPRSEAIRHSVETIARVRTSPEAQEGLRAFLDKRPASWIAP